MRFALIVWSLFLALPEALAQPGIWSDVFNVSRNDGTSLDQDIVMDGQDNIHLAWIDNTRLGGGGSAANMDILYGYFNGQAWSPCQQLSDSSASFSSRPQLSVDQLQRPHVVWFDNWYIYEGYYARVLYSFAQDSQWSALQFISEGAHYNFYPDIAVDASNHVHVAWHGVLPGAGFQILYRIFDGNQWQPIQSLTSMPNGCSQAKIRVDSQNRLHLVFVEGYGYSCQIMYMINDGVSWSEPVFISGIVGLGAHDPELALDENDHPHIVWQQNVPNVGMEIYYSGFNGASWSTPLNVTDLSGNYYYPRIAVAPGKIFVTCHSGGPGYQDYLHYTYSQDGDWAAADTIFPSYGANIAPIAFDSNHHLHALISCSYGMSINYEILQIDYVDSSLFPITLTPHNPPITIPAGGGSFSFDVRIENHAVLSVPFDAWIEAVLPNGGVYGPIILRQNLNLPSGGMLFRPNLNQTVPGGAPAGEYLYRLRAGDYSDSIIVSSDSFSFVKEGVSVSGGSEWQLEGWDSDSPIKEKLQPTSFALLPPRPNPFNSSTTLCFNLPQASHVKLSVFDISGRQVAALVDGFRDAGIHEVTWDAAGLPSGIYCARLNEVPLSGGAGSRSAVQKLVLMK